MTSIAIWYEPKDDRLWVVGDTQTTRGSLQGVLSFASAKILPLSIRCWAPGQSGFFDQPTHNQTFGFTFAGGTFPATMTYAAVNAALSALVSSPGTPPPSILDVAIFVARVGTRYVRETSSPFEAAIVGWCPELEAFQVATIASDGCSPLSLRTKIETLERKTILLGSHKAAVQAKIAEVEKRLEGQELRRAPALALREIVTDEALEGIGGTLQKAYAYRRGFQLLLSAEPGSPFRMTLMGLDVMTDLGGVGNYAFGLPGTI